MDLTPEQKFEALKMRYEDHVELLRFNARQDMEIFGGYIALQGFLAGFLAKIVTPLNIWIKVGICFIDLSLTIIAFVFLRNNTGRRKEVLKTLHSVMSAIGFDKPGVFADTAINPEYKFRAWSPWYFTGIWVIFLGVNLILFLGLK